MSKEKGFDLPGLFFVVNELNRSFAIPLPEWFEQLGFCSFCLGANSPGILARKGQWCCGSWCDGILPLLKICERFQVDRERVMEVAKEIRPTETSTSTSSSHSACDVMELSVNINGVIIKIPIK